MASGPLGSAKGPLSPVPAKAMTGRRKDPLPSRGRSPLRPGVYPGGCSAGPGRAERRINLGQGGPSVLSCGMSTEFRDLTLAAVAAWRDLALNHLDSGGYVPRETLPRLEKFASGWPNLTAATFSDSDGQPRNLA
jgi:hypothetical protein